MDETYYDFLGVSKDATEDQIERAYQELKAEAHSNQNTDTESSEQFRRIETAYETLCTPSKRAKYDQLGHERYVQQELGDSEDVPTPNTTDPDSHSQTDWRENTRGHEAADRVHNWGAYEETAHLTWEGNSSPSGNPSGLLRRIIAYGVVFVTMFFMGTAAFGGWITVLGGSQPDAESLSTPETIVVTVLTIILFIVTVTFGELLLNSQQKLSSTLHDLFS